MDTNIKFQWHDYILFAIMLTTSALIGSYFGYVGRNKNSTTHFLLGGKSMKPFPVAMSLASSVTTSIALTSIPADVYKFGVALIVLSVSVPLLFAFSYYAILPVYYNLQLTSIYEYMGLRFNRRIQLITSFLFLLTMLIYIPVIIYLPALAIAQGTGFNVNFITVVVSVVCIFYTTIGGMKTVVWTDALQMVFILATFIIITIIGSVRSGGLSEIWRSSADGDRLNIDFDLDPTKEFTFWTLMIGFMTHWLHYTICNQSCIQKCLALPTMEDIKQSISIASVIFAVKFLCTTIIGLAIYTEFKECDPLISKKITTYDQLLPYYVLNVTRDIPGLVGLFIAGLFSASISSLSAGLNSLSCTIYNDFLQDLLPSNYSQKRIKRILIAITLVMGLICGGLVFAVQKLGNAFPIVIGVKSIASGPMLGLFILGMFSTRANSKGATWGVIASIIFMSWLIITTQYYKINKYITPQYKHVSVAACPLDLNTTNIGVTPDWRPPFIYRISFYYNPFIGMLVVLLVGLPVSWLSKPEAKLRKELISPIMHWALPKYQSVPQVNKERSELTES